MQFCHHDGRWHFGREWGLCVAGHVSRTCLGEEVTKKIDQGLKKRTRKAFGIRKKEKDTDSTGSPDRDGSKKTNGAPNGFYTEIDWERYNSPEVDDEGYSIRPDDKSGSTKGKHFYSSSESESDEDTRRKFNVKIRPLQAKDAVTCMAASVDELKVSVGNISLSPSPMVSVLSSFLPITEAQSSNYQKGLIM